MWTDLTHVIQNTVSVIFSEHMVCIFYIFLTCPQLQANIYDLRNDVNKTILLVPNRCSVSVALPLSFYYLWPINFVNK